MPLIDHAVNIFWMRRRSSYYVFGGLLGGMAVFVLGRVIGIAEHLLSPLLLLAAVLAGGAGFLLHVARTTRLELRPDSLRMKGLGFNVVSPWANVERLGPSPANPQHMALIFRRPPPVFEGRIAEAFRSRGMDGFLDLSDFMAGPADTEVLAAIRLYAPHA